MAAEDYRRRPPPLEGETVMLGAEYADGPAKLCDKLSSVVAELGGRCVFQWSDQVTIALCRSRHSAEYRAAVATGVDAFTSYWLRDVSRAESASIAQRRQHLPRLFRLRPAAEAALQLLPAAYREADAWADRGFVRLPCSPLNTVDGGAFSKWGLVHDVLSVRLDSADVLEEALLELSFNRDVDVGLLLRLVEEEMDEAEAARFWGATLPGMQRAALRLPLLAPEPLPLLGAGSDGEVFVSAPLAASLLANAFFGTFPLPADRAFPPFTFEELLSRGSRRSAAARMEKLRALLAYFHARCGAGDDSARGGLTVVRSCEDTSELDWQLDAPLCALRASAVGVIEDSPPEFVHVDFANRVVGGGVLGNGCVQEEIRFVISPELIVGRLLAAPLNANETLLLLGSERFARYEGYSYEFRFAGAYADRRALDPATGQLRSAVLALDAADYSRCGAHTQYTAEAIERELEKAWTGFRSAAARGWTAIATGNWGAGAFAGDPRLKALLQWAAATKAGCAQIQYYTFDDVPMAEQLRAAARRAQEEGWTVADLVAHCRPERVEETLRLLFG